mgnify:CR=1 FL=1
MSDIMDRVGLSATGGDASRPLEEVLESSSSMGYRYFEAWLQGRGSAMDISRGPEPYIELARRFGMGYCSLHMRTVDSDDEPTIDRAGDPPPVHRQCRLYPRAVCGAPVRRNEQRQRRLALCVRVSSCSDVIPWRQLLARDPNGPVK